LSGYVIRVGHVWVDGLEGVVSTHPHFKDNKYLQWGDQNN
jgi:hypothetical protein